MRTGTTKTSAASAEMRATAKVTTAPTEMRSATSKASTTTAEMRAAAKVTGPATGPATAPAKVTTATAATKVTTATAAAMTTATAAAMTRSQSWFSRAEARRAQDGGQNFQDFAISLHHRYSSQDATVASPAVAQEF